MRRAVREGALAPDVTIADLLTLITGIALATEHHPDPAAEANRLLDLAVVIGPSGVSGSAPVIGRRSPHL